VSKRRPAPPVAAGESLPAPRHFDHLWLGAQLRRLIGSPRGRALCVAYSGGLDSSALLCVLAALRAREGFTLRALHVNHQLQPGASDWARQAQHTAGRLRIPCEVLKVAVRRGRGESLEAVARAARYQALLSRLRSDECLVTAHHQEDQLETLLLALMRGSGLRGLSAMGPVSRIEGRCVLRPLLPIARVQLEEYAQKRGVVWSEDPSNADERFDRNYLRRIVVPRLRARWPGVATTVTRSASHLAQARALLEKLGNEQLSPARDGPTLRVSVLRRLPPAERINALRVWFTEQALPLPDYDRMGEIAGPMLSARADGMPCVRWQGAELRRHGDRLLAYPVRESQKQAAIEVERWNWRTHPWLSLGSAGELGLVRDRHGDVRLAALPGVLSVRYRRGGERLGGAHGRFALKDLLQRKGLVPWAREDVPLVMHDHTVVAVADLWLCPQFAAHSESGHSGTSHSGAGRSGTASGRARFRWRHNGAD